MYLSSNAIGNEGAHALADALRSGRVAAAALDVHCKEPFARDEGALAGAPNLYCTPHNAWYSPESRHEMRRKGAEAALRLKLLCDHFNRRIAQWEPVIEECTPRLMVTQEAADELAPAVVPSAAAASLNLCWACLRNP